jgi:hypothetical protein
MLAAKEIDGLNASDFRDAERANDCDYICEMSAIG